MAKFELRKSFNIDNGELDGKSLQECFVLGYELAMIDSLLEAGLPISKPVHAANQARIMDSCLRAGRSYQLEWLADDTSESWMQLTVN